MIPIEGQTVDPDSNEDIEFERVSILETSFILKPGQFILGSTFEKFLVPRDLVCHIVRAEYDR